MLLRLLVVVNAIALFFVFPTKRYIQAKSKHRILIPVGKIGLGWKKNESVLLEANRTYYIDDGAFKCAC